MEQRHFIINGFLDEFIKLGQKNFNPASGNISLMLRAVSRVGAGGIPGVEVRALRNLWLKGRQEGKHALRFGQWLDATAPARAEGMGKNTDKTLAKINKLFSKGQFPGDSFFQRHKTPIVLGGGALGAYTLYNIGKAKGGSDTERGLAEQAALQQMQMQMQAAQEQQYMQQMQSQSQTSAEVPNNYEPEVYVMPTGAEVEVENKEYNI